MTRILNPMVVGIVGLLLSLAVGIAASWRTLNAMVLRTIEYRQETQPNQYRKKGWDFWTIEMANLSSELNDQREILKQRSQALDQREARIVAGEKELAKARADIDAMQKDISERVIEMSADEAVNLRKLSQTYANLSPRAVVAIVREMDDSTAVKILNLMKPDVVGPIFEEMSKTAGTDGTLAKRAAVLSEKLRLMKASKPTAAP